MPKVIPIAPVTGFMDTRSTADEVPFGGYRMARNWHVTQKHRLRRITGYTKFWDVSPYNNQDLHDQLKPDPQTINMVYHARLISGFTKVFVGTQNRLYALNNSSRNYQIISDCMGSQYSGTWQENVWSVAHIGTTVVFTNDYDKPAYHIIDQPLSEAGCGELGQGVAAIEDLKTLNVTKVRLVVSWNNLMFYMNIEQDGERRANRILWSDYKRPLSLIEKADVSLAGHTDLMSGEVILNAKPLQESLLVYTNLSIWEIKVTGTAEVISVRRRYSSDEAGSRALAYWRTLVSDGKSHYYMGQDGIYKYDMYTPVPELVDFIHRASSMIFDTIKRTSCSVHCAGFYPKYRQIKFSWANEGEDLPHNTLVVGTEFLFTSLENEGFTAFSNTEPHGNKSIRDFLEEQCICTPEELNYEGQGFINEGGYCQSPILPDCPNRPASFYTQTLFSYEGLDIEDWTKAAADADSLCEKFEGLKVNQLCADEFAAGQCAPYEAFIQVATQDNCLKQADDVYYREHCTSIGSVCGVYSQDGYRSLILSGALHFSEPEAIKAFSQFMAEIEAEASITRGRIKLSIGTAAQAVDPLTESGYCKIFWQEQDTFELKCQSDSTKAEDLINQESPDKNYVWGLYMRGKYLYFQLEIDVPANNDVGAPVSISRFEVGVVKTV